MHIPGRDLGPRSETSADQSSGDIVASATAVDFDHPSFQGESKCKLKFNMIFSQLVQAILDLLLDHPKLSMQS